MMRNGRRLFSGRFRLKERGCLFKYSRQMNTVADEEVGRAGIIAPAWFRDGGAEFGRAGEGAH